VLTAFNKFKKPKADISITDAVNALKHHGFWCSNIVHEFSTYPLPSLKLHIDVVGPSLELHTKVTEFVEAWHGSGGKG
jgi:hypothetical protein